jgi:hypothetical protein
VLQFSSSLVVDWLEQLQKLKFLQKSEKTDVQCKASLNRRLLLAVVLVGGDAEETKNLQC